MSTYRTIFQKILSEKIENTVITPVTPSQATTYYQKLERKREEINTLVPTIWQEIPPNMKSKSFASV